MFGTDLFEPTAPTDPCVDEVGPGTTLGPIAAALIAGAASGVVGGVIKGVMGGGGGGGGSPLIMPPNPHVMTPTTYAMHNTASYVAGRGFRRR